MARQTNGTNQGLQTSSAIDFAQATLMSLSFWLSWDAYADDDDLAIESASFGTGAGSDMTMQVNPNSSSPTGVFLVNIRGNGGNNSVYFTRPSALTQHHYLINIDVSHATQEIREIYVDSASQSLTQQQAFDNTVGGFGSRVLHFMSRDNASLFGAGIISEVAYWTGVNLSGANATSLFGGALPTSIQSGNLVQYWKMCGVTSPEPAQVGGVNLTVNGATLATHPIAGSCSTPITGLRPAICV